MARKTQKGLGRQLLWIVMHPMLGALTEAASRGLYEWHENRKKARNNNKYITL